MSLGDKKYSIFIAGAIGGEIAPATEVTLPASSEEKPIVTPSGSRRHTYYDVTAEETANGTIALSGTHVLRGTEVTITGEPAEGCVLKALYLNGEAVEAKSPYTFNIYADTTVKAEFEKTQEQLIKETNAYNSTIQLIAKSKIAKTAKKEVYFLSLVFAIDLCYSCQKHELIINKRVSERFIKSSISSAAI